jgi:hypothetical protein
VTWSCPEHLPDRATVLSSLGATVHVQVGIKYKLQWLIQAHDGAVTRASDDDLLTWLVPQTNTGACLVVAPATHGTLYTDKELAESAAFAQGTAEWLVVRQRCVATSSTLSHAFHADKYVAFQPQPFPKAAIVAAHCDFGTKYEPVALRCLLAVLQTRGLHVCASVPNFRISQESHIFGGSADGLLSICGPEANTLQVLLALRGSQHDCSAAIRAITPHIECGMYEPLPGLPCSCCSPSHRKSHVSVCVEVKVRASIAEPGATVLQVCSNAKILGSDVAVTATLCGATLAVQVFDEEHISKRFEEALGIVSERAAVIEDLLVDSPAVRRPRASAASVSELRAAGPAPHAPFKIWSAAGIANIRKLISGVYSMCCVTRCCDCH